MMTHPSRLVSLLVFNMTYGKAALRLSKITHLPFAYRILPETFCKYNLPMSLF